MKHPFRALIAVTALFLAAGCANPHVEGFEVGLRDETASRLAAPSFMVKRRFAAAPFELTRYERVHAPGETAVIYIEGDGFPWMSKGIAAMDPTPKNPVALHLATRDNSRNVIYMAKPCQYSGMLDPGESCSVKHWTRARFSPEVIAAMDASLDDLKTRHQFSGFHLVGFSGGGAVAALLAERREDILSLRTVGGLMDTDAFTGLHAMAPLSESLNPATDAAKIAAIPQHHFIGLQDEIMPAPIYDSFARAAGPSPCLRSSFVDGADHETGWVDKWPELLKLPVDCKKTP